jgi:hypothetical protein
MRIVYVFDDDRYIDCGATETARPSTGQLRGQRQASGMHGALPGREGTLAAVLNEVGLSAAGQVFFPCSSEVRPRLVEA